MNTKILFGAIMALVLFTTSYAQTPDKAKLDQFFDRLAEKNKAMGSIDSKDPRSRNIQRIEKRFFNHECIALRIISRHVSFVTKEKIDLIPIYLLFKLRRCQQFIQFFRRTAPR